MPESKPPILKHFRPEWLMSQLTCVTDAVITTDTQERVTSLNSVAESLTGWNQAEAVGVALKDVFRIVNTETRTTVESPTVRALRDGVNVELPKHTLLIAKNGKEYSIGPIDHSATPIRNVVGELAGAVLIFRDVSELCRQERAVHTALHFAENIISKLREPFLVLDNDLQIRTANRAFYERFQVEANGVEGRSIFEMGGGQWDITPMRALLNEVLTGHASVQDFNVEVDFPTIGKRLVLLNARRFGSVENHPDLILLAMEDITERKRTERALQQVQQRQRFILDSIPQKLATTKPDGSVDYFNPQWMEYTGLTFEQLQDFGWKQIIHPDDVGDHVREWLYATQAGEVFEHESRFRRADGEYRWHISRGVPMRNEAGQVAMWMGANTDIHDIKVIELALVDSEIRYRRLFETAKDGILILDTKSGRITDANPYMSELLGYSLEHFLGKEMWEIGLFQDKSANEAAVRTLQDEGYIRYEHLPLETSQGLQVEVEVVANAYQVDDHKVIQCNIRDITERSQLEKQMLEQVEALAGVHRRKDEFLAMLSHELRNPLAPIANAVQLLGLQKHEDPLQCRARTIIERQVGHLTRLIDDLLEVSRITTGKIHLQLERIDLNGIVALGIETTRPLIDKSRHELKVSLSSQPVWVYGDRARLEQVVVNFLTNAAKYTDDGGTIAITLEKDDEEAVLRVKDTGVGIAAELLPHIFELFTQSERSLDRSQGGLGIGLCLVQRLVNMHGGHVEVKSTVGSGSEFLVYLPMMMAHAVSPNSQKSISAGVSGVGLRVLVVDDNLDAAQTLGMLLEETGHDVQLACDGPTALQMTLAYRPHVVLLDIGLPGFDGYEVARKIRDDATLKDIVLVAITGYGHATDIRRSSEVGFDYHLVKPADFMKIREILATISGRSN
ncbi:MAG: PAS domain S-box protein [Planctomycetaceae bacterium]